MQIGETHYTFSVLQYRHDSLIDEALNVGVLLSAPDIGFLRIKTVVVSTRLKQTYPDMDTKGFLQRLREIETKICSFAKEMREGASSSDEITSSSIALKLHTEDDSSLRWLKPGAGVTSSPKEELELLFYRYVSRWDKSSSQESPLSDDLFEIRNKKLSADNKLILRSLYYKQAVTSFLTKQERTVLERNIKVLKMARLITQTQDGLRLTVAGVRALKYAYGSKRPPFIDFKQDARLPTKDKKKEFIVGNSLASAIAREVSSGK